MQLECPSQCRYPVQRCLTCLLPSWLSVAAFLTHALHGTPLQANELRAQVENYKAVAQKKSDAVGEVKRQLAAAKQEVCGCCVPAVRTTHMRPAGCSARPGWLTEWTAHSFFFAAIVILYFKEFVKEAAQHCWPCWRYWSHSSAQHIPPSNCYFVSTHVK